MAQLITFSTGKFDITTEIPNPINPIFGEGVLHWVRDQLAATPYRPSTPEPEDWGWYITVEDDGTTYVVGASGQPERTASEIDWIIQVHKQRSLTDKLTGRNTMSTDDPLVALLERVVREEPAFRNVSVERDA